MLNRIMALRLGLVLNLIINRCVHSKVESARITIRSLNLEYAARAVA
jgi:hypothetical protein